jgi:molybdate/tungstate transport system substrate-binding protein
MIMANAADLTILYAGSLERLVREDLLPQFERLTGYRVSAYAGASRQWGMKLRQGEAIADVLLSADAAVNENELMRPGEAVAEWYLTFAANELVLAYSPASAAAAEMHALAQRPEGWLQMLQRGYRLGRSDPDADPKGYRTLFVLQLAERQYGLAKLCESVTGAPRNPAQLFDPAQLPALLRQGSIDLAFSYRNQAQEEELPFVVLPDAINLGSPSHTTHYEGVGYTCSDGTCYCGGLIAYTATPLAHAPQPLAATAFLVFLATDAAVEAIARHGFRPTQALTHPR